MPKDPDERRIDPSDGGAYTFSEFVDEYGGTDEWTAAAPMFSTEDVPAPLVPVNERLLKALLCAALYPQVVLVETPEPKKGGKSKGGGGGGGAIKFKIREGTDPRAEPVAVAIASTASVTKIVLAATVVAVEAVDAAAAVAKPVAAAEAVLVSLSPTETLQRSMTISFSAETVETVEEEVPLVAAVSVETVEMVERVQTRVIVTKLQVKAAKAVTPPVSPARRHAHQLPISGAHILRQSGSSVS